MEIRSSIDNNIEILIEKKNRLRDSFKKNPDEVLDFYNSLKSLDLINLKKIFPSPRAVIEQEIFDTTNEIISADSMEECARVSVALFRRKNTEESNPELFEKDLLLLQALFFYLLRDICNEDTDLFDIALQNGSWFSAKKQTELLNSICSKLNFSNKAPFSNIDFRNLKGNHFEQNESLLRIFYNFMHPRLYLKEGIVNELNFVREQQKLILPVMPNLRKTNWKKADALRRQLPRAPRGAPPFLRRNQGLRAAGVPPRHLGSRQSGVQRCPGLGMRGRQPGRLRAAARREAARPGTLGEPS